MVSQGGSGAVMTTSRQGGGATRATRWLAHLAIRAYQLTFSGLIGRQCRHLPTCSDYCDEAISTYGLWAGGWMGLARICRCHPLGTAGFDPVPDLAPEGAHWLRPWSFGKWRGPLVCDLVESEGRPHGGEPRPAKNAPAQDRAPSSIASA